ncbi:bestrophin-like domain [Nonomuraea endophytica]|uniref:bestrophin-like domain n=1 Tax=Nonomuraea endophytica TaxID=714136 RepID=UPI0037CB1144
MFVALVGVVVALVAAAIAGLAAYLADRAIAPKVRQDFREGSGLVSGIIGTLFAISVGLVVVASWNQVNSATQTSSTEASNLVDVYWYSRSLPEPQREKLRRLADEYTTTVIRHEWPLMAEQRTLSPAAWRSVEQLRAFFQTIEPTTSAASTRYGQAMSRIQAVLDARRTRAQMADTGVPPLLWIALAGCGLTVVVPAVVCGGPVRKVHITMAAVVGGLVGMVLFLVYQLDFPFSGGVTVSPAAFEQALDRFASIRSLGTG